MLLIPCKIVATTGKITDGVFDADHVFVYAVHPLNPERTLIISPNGHEMIVSATLTMLMQVINDADRIREELDDDEEDEETEQ